MDKVLRLVVSTVFFGALLFVLAGTVRWPAAWVYMALVAASLTVYSAILIRLHPELIQERSKPPADAKKWDKPLVALVGAVGPLLLLTVCGLDRRFGWSGVMPAWLTVAGLLAVVAGHVLTNCAVAANRFFSAIVRIQRDRGHTVVEAGPYRLIRHPGYLGSILHMFGTGFALGSWWGVDVAAVLSLVVAFRTALEDRTLARELEGYADYTARVRFRLLPGIW